MGQARSFRIQCTVLAVGIIAITAFCFLRHGRVAAAGAAMAGVFALVFFLVVMGKRHAEIRRLAAEIDEILHTGRTVGFSDYKEGDVAILKNEMSKMVARLANATEQLAEEKHSLARALADISHQIRTPLTAISLMFPALEATDDPALRKLQLHKLEHMVERLSWLVTSLLKMAKLEAGSYTMDCVEVDAMRLIGAACDPLRLSFDLHDVELKTDVEPGTVLKVDPRWSAEALGNIVKNCLEHTPDGGTVSVSARQNALGTRIEVRDSGPGIAEEDLPHVFERFYRGSDGEGAGEERGFGIGLALTQAIIAAQGGSVRAANNPEGGAGFSIVFPELVV